MMSAGVAGRIPARSRFDASSPRRLRAPLYRPPSGHSGWPVAAVVLSVLGHVLFVAAVAGLMLWTTWNRPKLYVVNLVPAVAAVGVATAPPVRSTPVRAPVREPTPAPAAPPPPPEREPAPRPAPVREPARLPEPARSAPRLPTRPALPRPGEKELPPMSRPRVATAPPVTRPERTETARPVDPRPAPTATLGQPTGSPAGVGALSLDASDFPHAWYLRQVLQKVQGEWQRQNRTTEPDQKPHILVEIRRDGTIRMPELQQTSGNALYDQAALRAVFDASPFPPLPQDWSKPSLRVMFRFDLTPVRG
jgi:TonB family protein